MYRLVKFDELVLRIPGDELRVKFHPRMTVLSGLGAPEREALASSILGSLVGGPESTAMRYVDSTGRVVNLLSGPDGPVHARHEDDGSAALPPVRESTSPTDLRSLMLVRAADLGVVSRTPRADEPPELRDARLSLEEITAELEEALAEEQALKSLRAELKALEEQLRQARDGAARREYAEVLAQLERVRAESATLQSGTAGADADRHLLASADAVQDLATRWRTCAAELTAATERFAVAERLDPDARTAAAALPDAAPADLSTLIGDVVEAEATRAAMDNRLQVLAVATLPAPTHPLVSDLGLLDQDALWSAAHRLIAAGEEVERAQVSLGGLGGDEAGPPPAVISEMEAAHEDVESAEQAAEAARLPGVAGSGLGVAIAMVGTISTPFLIPVGLLVAGGVGISMLVQPKRRIARAAAAERAALERAGVPSYLSFHLRRVDATVDPNVRGTVDVAANEHRSALTTWTEMVGEDLDVHEALGLESEVRAYHAALQNLGDAADEIAQLRRDLTERAEPALATAQEALAAACGPFGLSADDVVDPEVVPALVAAAIQRGRSARAQGELEIAEAREHDAGRDLGAQLLQLGFDGGDLEARLGALDWAVARAGEREQARTDARPIAVVEADLAKLQEAARRLHRPEWAEVTAEEAGSPDIEELEEQRDKLLVRLDEVQQEVDVVRLADRQAALERRVMALEARHGGHDANGDPGAVADIQQHLFGRLTQAATAGPQGDPLPAVLDEVFLRVPAERKWDLLDLLHRLSERHQLIYLTDDPFVGAWANQKANDDLTLLAPEPEAV
jgi:hypothetical protein